MQRLNKYIASSGLCSRRKADELIEKGSVSVNGRIIREMGYQVSPKDKVVVNKVLIRPKKLEYYKFYKPAGYITTSEDENGRKTIYDVIPKEFELTAESITALEEKGVKVTKNKTTGETTLEWTIGDLQGNKDNSLTYTVKANDDYHGSIYTNTKATLSADIDKDNPYPEYKDQTNLNLTFDKPTVEIPAVIKDDHYNDREHDSYNGYENTTINGVESILTNDLTDKLRDDIASNATNVEVVDEVIINTDTNVVKIANNTYTISKDGVLQGTLTMHDDGTFTFDPKAGITGEVSFTYYVKTTINEHHETETVRSKNATVTLNIISARFLTTNLKRVLPIT